MPKPANFGGPIPGESYTLPPKTYPFDRPPKHTRPDKAVDEIFNMLMQEKTAKNALMLMEWGIPISMLTELVSQQAYGEGLVSAYMIPLIAGPVGAILAKMAKGAGIDPKFRFEDNTSIADVIARIKGSNITEDQMEDAIENAHKSKKVSDELPKDVEQKSGGGLMSKVGM